MSGPSPALPSQAPKVSILLCLYNGERYLAPTIESALRQTFPEFELIVIDDGSTDASVTVVDRYRHDPRLHLIRQQNRGPAGAIKTGLDHARGTYIAFLDQDDLWEPENLQAHVDLLNSRPEIDVSFSWFRVIDETGRETGPKSTRYRGTIDFQGLLADFVIAATSNTVARRAAIDKAGGIDPSFRLVFNLDLCLRIALLASHNIAAVPRDLMLYRRHPGQSSQDAGRMMGEWQRAVEKVRRLAPEQVAAALPQALCNQQRYLARLNYEREHYRAALGFLARGFSCAPAVFLSDSRNWLTGAASVSGLLLPRCLHRTLERKAGYRRSLS
jgi:glycosyltransferase involved in cell wall biosynthesis